MTREWKLDLPAVYPHLATEDSPYDYAILVDQVDLGSFSCESYGAVVTAPATGDRAQVANITVDPDRIDRLMELLVRCQVGPTHLRDVVDDWL